jgi:hypothetical protein
VRVHSARRRFPVAAALVALAATVALGTAGSRTEDAKLTASDGVGGDHLGVSVAASGDTVVAGTAERNDDVGAAYVFRRNGQVWTQEALLTPTGPADKFFGGAVAISGDTLVVGAYGQPGERGSAFVFTRTGTTWTQQQKLTATGGALADQFGISVAVDGDTAVVGATGVGAVVGAAYVFTRTGLVWTQQAKLVASDGDDGDSFGNDVAISGDTVIVGAFGVGFQHGAAYVFKRTGTDWAQEARLDGTDPSDTAQFGYGVALAGDTAAIGSSGTGNYRGSVYVFTRAGTTWTQQALLVAADGSASDRLGSAVALVGDRLLAGAHFKYISEGVAYVFERTGTAWSQKGRLAATGAKPSDFLGFGVALTSEFAVASGFGFDERKGAAFVFDLGAGPAPPAGYCLPAKVKVKLNKKRASLSTFTLSGTLDTGGVPPDFTGPATFEAGGFRLVIPEFVTKGKTRRFVFGTDKLTLKPPTNGSSRTAFSAKFTGDVSEVIDVNGPVAFCFANGAHRLAGVAKLTTGALRPNGVTAPGLAVLKASATVKGGGKDSLALTLSFPGDGVVPGAAEDLTIGFGGTFTSGVLPASSFVSKGNAWVRTAKAPGITKATVDYAKSTITIAGSGLDLGAFATGGNAVAVTVTRGADTRSATVRMGLNGTKLSY